MDTEPKTQATKPMPPNSVHALRSVFVKRGRGPKPKEAKILHEGLRAVLDAAKAELAARPHPAAQAAVDQVGAELSAMEDALEREEGGHPALDAVREKHNAAVEHLQQVAARGWPGDQPPTKAEVRARREELDHANAVAKYWFDRNEREVRRAEVAENQATSGRLGKLAKSAEQHALDLLGAFRRLSSTKEGRERNVALAAKAISKAERPLAFVYARQLADTLHEEKGAFHKALEAAFR